jgi:hypothetical protein
MKTLILILSIITFGLTQFQRADSGLEIYQVKKPYPDSTKQTKPECYYCLDLQSKDLFEKPLLTEKDFKKFDWNNQRIELTEEAKQRMNQLKIPLEGLPVAIVLNGEIIYGFWFWNAFSSFGCDRVYTYPTLDFTIKFGIPSSNTFGSDPRFDERLKKYSELKKQKN